MKAASAVVLQRELSLTRRVYTWLLGSNEASDKQIQYFRANSLDLLSGTLGVSDTQSITLYLPGRHGSCIKYIRDQRVSKAFSDLPVLTRQVRGRVRLIGNFGHTSAPSYQDHSGMSTVACGRRSEYMQAEVSS